jgi:transposase
MIFPRRDRIEVVAIDPSATFRSALETALPAARISVDHWHLVRQSSSDKISPDSLPA